MVTLGLSVGQGATEPKRKWSDWAGKLLWGWKWSMCSITQQTILLWPIWQGYSGVPQSESLARLMISMLSEQLRSCHFLKKRYGNQNKEMRQESKWMAGSPTQPYYRRSLWKQMEKRAVHFIASRTKNYADKRELMNMVNELLGIQYNIAKANRTDRKVQNLAWKKRVSAQDLRNRRIRRYFVCRLKRSEARNFSHVRFSSYKNSIGK